MAKIRKFPRQVSVKIEHGGDGEDWLVANVGKDMLGHAELGQTVKVAIYELVEVREVQGVATHKIIG